jgi:lipopolysaccharide export system protein LptA
MSADLPFRLRPLLFPALCCLLLGAGSVSAADRSQQPLVFSADQMRIDERQKIRVLSGQVELTRGGLQIRADRVELRGLPGEERLTATAADGSKVRFHQVQETPAASGDVVEGLAERIEFDARAEVLRLTGQSVLRRWRGGAMADEMSGHSIIYDRNRDTWEVSGQQSGRVRGVLTPRQDAAASAGGKP